MVEEALTFTCEGEGLVGVVAKPDTPCAVGILVVVGGPQYRVGSHRQFVASARRFAGQGVPVMRFDYRGMGDSSGAPRSFENIDGDIAAAIAAFITATPGLEKIVLWGLCDAASACLLYCASTEDERIAGLVLLNPWILSEAGYAETQIRDYYLRRLATREFWLKLARGGVDVVGAARSLAGFAASALSGRRDHRNAAVNDAMDYRERMMISFGQLGCPVLFIYSGADLTANAFLEHCRASSAWSASISRAHVEQRNVADADHTFSTAASREEMEALTLDWLKRAFPSMPITTNNQRILLEEP